VRVLLQLGLEELVLALEEEDVGYGEAVVLGEGERVA